MRLPDGNRPVLRVERDSVCAGDDGDAPHAATFGFDRGDSLARVVAAVVAAKYLPGVAGGEATWTVRAAGRALAVVAQQWDAPAMLVNPAARLIDCVRSDHASLFFWLRGADRS